MVPLLDDVLRYSHVFPGLSPFSPDVGGHCVGSLRPGAHSQVDEASFPLIFQQFA
jgi:hypothetical protein